MKDLLDACKEKHFKMGNTNFIYDGIINQELYDKCPVKILFIFREGYYDENDYYGRKSYMPWLEYIDKKAHCFRCTECLKNAPKTWMMWKKMESITDHLLRDLSVPVGESKPIEYSAFIDLKKSRETYSDYEPDNNNTYTNDLSRILKYAKNDSELIKKQISIINPDIIICSGTYEICCQASILGNDEYIYEFDSGIRGIKSLRRQVFTFDGIAKTVWVADIWHLSASISPKTISSEISKKIIDNT